MTSWHSYPKIYNVGHRAVRDIFSQPVIVEEKVDGSQFSFGLINGELRMKSKNQELNEHTAPGLFATAAAVVKSLERFLIPDWTYRGEYLANLRVELIQCAAVCAAFVEGLDIATKG